MPAPPATPAPPRPARRGQEDPAVIAWRLALAPRPRHTTNGRHWWRELVWDHWSTAYAAWWHERERVALGYATEMAEFEAAHPCPRLGDFMTGLSRGSIDTYDDAQAYYAGRPGGSW